VTITLRLFAAAREAAGSARVELPLSEARTIEDALHVAVARFGDDFAAVLATSRVWLNGDEPSDNEQTTLHEGDEIAVLPPVSGGESPDRGSC
jgi:molybdopterin synthase sulfur carrier subunit